MTDGDKVAFTSVLVSHFPNLADGDAALCWRTTVEFDLVTARAAIERHRLELGSRAYRPDPNRIAAFCRDTTLEAEGPVKRTREYIDRLREDAQAIEREREAVDAFIAGLSDVELDGLKRSVLDSHGSGVRTMLERRNPRTSDILRAMIYVAAKGGAA